MTNLGDSGKFGSQSDMNGMRAFGIKKRKEWERKPAFTPAGNSLMKKQLTTPNVDDVVSKLRLAKKMR